MLGNLKLIAIGTAVALSILGGAYAIGRIHANTERDLDDAKGALKGAETAKEVQDEIRQKSDDDVLDALRPWMRPDD